MKNRYFLMRHGESEANLADLIISAPETGCAGYGLSPLGREQARISATASRLGPETLIVASDFLRTRETAEIAAEELGCAGVLIETRLRERFFGVREATSASHYEGVWEQDQNDPTHTSGGVESAQALAARLAEALADLEDRHSNRAILLVSHGDPLRFLQLQMAGRPLTDHLCIRFFEPAEIRALEELPQVVPSRT